MMILSALLVLAAGPTLDEAQTCRAHMELFIEDAMRESGRVAGPSWFIRDWWTGQAIDAGSPEDDDEIIAGRKEALKQLKATEPDRFQEGRLACVDTAIAAGAVPGMGPE